MVGTTGLGVAPSIGVLLAGEVTDSEAWAGLARTASTLGAAVFGVPLGNLASWRGRRVALSSGWAIAAVGATMLVFAAQLDLVISLFLGLFLFGAGSAVNLQARFAATDLAEPARKARALSLVVWVGTLGMVLGPNLAVPGKVLANATGLTVYAAAFALAAIVTALAGVLVFVFLRPDPMMVSDQLSNECPPKPGRRPGAIRGLFREMRSNVRARNAVIAIVSAQVVMVAIMTMTPVHVVHQGGSVELVGITISLHIVGMFAFAPIVGMLTDRLGNRFTMSVGTAILFTSLLIGVLWPDTTGWIVASLILLGLGWSFVNVSASALFARIVSSERRASSQGGVDALSNLCGAITAFAAGPLLALTNFAVLSVAAMVLLVPLLAILVRPARP